MKGNMLFYWIKEISPRTGLHLKKPLLVTVTYRAADELYIARTGCMQSAVGTTDQSMIVDVLLSMVVTRYYGLRLRFQDLAPDLYDEYRALCEYLG